MKAQVTVPDTLPYSTTAALRRFPANQTVFARMSNDPAFRSRIIDGGQTRTWDREDSALRDAAWAVLEDLSAHAYEKNVESGLTDPLVGPDDLGKLTTKLKRAASVFGAGGTGIARVNRLWLYAVDGEEVIPEHLGSVIVMVVPMDRDAISQSPSPIADAATGNGYARMAFVTSCMVNFVRRLGWSAVGCGNDTALSVPLAIDSGLGECGRNGILTTPDLGSCVRICKVFTDFPLLTDRPASLGMAEQCNRCRRCVRACPVGAISSKSPTSEGLGPSSNPGVVKWPVDGEKCRRFWTVNGNSCSNCIDACPYS
jgi:epoxyqueuosine reductase